MKNQDKKQALTLPIATLPVVTLTEKDMSELNGGRMGITPLRQGLEVGLSLALD